MKKLPLIARLMLGLIFFVFGLNGFFHFIPMPETMPDNMKTFMSGLMATGYFLPLLSGTQAVCGALLLIGAFVPLALIVLAPVILNIFLVHVFIDNNGLILAIVIGLLEVYLAFFATPYSDIVKQIFRCPMKEACKKNRSQS